MEIKDEFLRYLKEEYFSGHNPELIEQAYNEIKKEQELKQKEQQEENNEENTKEEITKDSRIKMTREELFEYKDNVLVVKEKYKYRLKEYDLSEVDWTDVDIRYLDLRDTNPDKLDPQKVHNKDFTGVDASADNKEKYIIKKEWNFEGVKFENTNLYCKDENNELEVIPSIIEAQIDYETWKTLPRKYRNYIIEKDKVPENIVQRAYEEVNKRINSKTKQDVNSLGVVIAEESKGKSI